MCLHTLKNRIFVQVEMPTSNDRSVRGVLIPVFIIDDFIVANWNGRRIRRIGIHIPNRHVQISNSQARTDVESPLIEYALLRGYESVDTLRSKLFFACFVQCSP